MLKIVCECGMELSFKKATFEVSKDKKQFSIAGFQCFRCNKKLLLGLVDMDKQDIKVTPKEETNESQR